MNFIACESLLFDIFSDIFTDIVYDQSVDRVIELRNFSNYIDTAYFIRYFRTQLHIILELYRCRILSATFALNST